MTHFARVLAASCLLAAAPVAHSLLDEQTAIDHIQRMGKLGKPAGAVLQYLVEDGRSLNEAVELAIGNSMSVYSQVALTRAALCSADATPETGQIALAASSEADEVRYAVERYDSRACNNMPEELPDFAGGSDATPGRGGIIVPVSPSS